MRKIIYNFTLPTPSITLCSYADFSLVEPHGEEGCIVVLAPSVTKDYYLSSIRDGVARKPMYLDIWCAGHYLHSICGLPYSTMEFDTPHGLITAEFFDTGDGQTGILMNKCKQTVTKSVELFGSASATVSTVLYSGSLYRLLHTKRAELASPSVLRQMRILPDLPDCFGAIALSSAEAVGTEEIDPLVGAAIIASYRLASRCEKNVTDVSYCGSTFRAMPNVQDSICIRPLGFHCTRVVE